MMRFVLTCLLCGLLAGCGSVSFYWQAMNGQWDLSRRARPIDTVIADTTTPAQLRERLQRVQRIRRFASAELALPDNKSYRKYADLQRPYVVWNVFAAEAFSLHPKEWCFPFAGCVGYRGYFDEKSARAFAAGLRARGLDVYVGGVPAYSTLGYFDDPVLNTFIHYPESEVARLIFHELSHQVVYLKGDSSFNESFATTVEIEGVRRYIAATGNSEMQQAFDTAQSRKRDFLELVERHRKRLETLYGSPLPAEEMRAQKEMAFAAMRADYAALKQSWGGFAGYDHWFGQDLNNAQMVSVAIYTQWVPGFQKMLSGRNGDLKRFYEDVNRLSKQSQAERREALLVAP